MSKVSWKDIFCGISINSFRKQMYFYEKNLFCIQPLWCTAKLDKFLEIYLVLAKEMAQIWHLWQELLKSTSKIWKSEGINNYIVIEDKNLWQILVEVLLELIKTCKSLLSLDLELKCIKIIFAHLCNKLT